MLRVKIMICIICLDQMNGMIFNHRRQSQDRCVRKDILDMVGSDRLYMTAYSYKQFEEKRKNIIVSENAFNEADRGEYCFIEEQIFDESKIEKLIVYRWDKIYPRDYRFEFMHWRLIDLSEFQGYSHEKIAKEVYIKNV